MKTYLTAYALQVWGIQKVTTHQYLNAIVLLASALDSINEKADDEYSPHS
jgi:hypothetical protein